MIVYINSYYSLKPNCTDGLYKVTVPEEFEKDFKECISEVGRALDDWYAQNWERLEECAASDGACLARALKALKWEFEQLDCLKYDSDYDEFQR